MFDISTIFLGVVLALLGYFLFWFGNIIKNVGSATKFQSYSEFVDASLLDAGVMTEHGIVYDPVTKTVSAHHKRSRVYYESVL